MKKLWNKVDIVYGGLLFFLIRNVIMRFDELVVYFILFILLNIIVKELMRTSQKDRLPMLLNNLHAKRSALFLQKLVLFDSDPQSDGSVRHYDYDCEGMQILVGIFKKKQQNVLMKAFNCIKNSPLLLVKRPPTTQRKPWNYTTRRSNLNSTFTASEGTPIRYAGLTTIRSKQNEQNHHKDSNVGSGSKKLHELLSKVRAVNVSNASETERRRTQSGLNRDSANYYLQNSSSRYISHLGNLSCRNNNENYYNKYFQSQRSNRQSRRQFILDKFNRIENNITQLQEGEEGVKMQQTMQQDIRQEIAFLRQRLTTRAIRRSAQV